MKKENKRPSEKQDVWLSWNSPRASGNCHFSFGCFGRWRYHSQWRRGVSCWQSFKASPLPTSTKIFISWVKKTLTSIEYVGGPLTVISVHSGREAKMLVRHDHCENAGALLTTAASTARHNGWIIPPRKMIPLTQTNKQNWSLVSCHRSTVIQQCM